MVSLNNLIDQEHNIRIQLCPCSQVIGTVFWSMLDAIRRLVFAHIH